MSINVLLVDDHELVRTGVKRLLADTADIAVFAESASGEEAIRQVRKQRPDVILMDIHMPGIGGLEATRRLLKSDPELKIIVVSVFGEEPLPTRLLKLGAAGYLTKGCALDEMVAAIRAVHRGKRYLAPDIAQQLALASVPGGNTSPFDDLTDREMQVLLMVSRGFKNQEIAQTLHLSPKTVSTHRYNIYDKLSVRNDVELAAVARRHGLIQDLAASAEVALE